MNTAIRLYTEAEFLVLPDEPGMRQELVRGEVLTISPPGGVQGQVAMRLGRRLGNHVEVLGLGETFAAETGFLIARDPDTVRGAAVSFRRRDLVNRTPRNTSLSRRTLPLRWPRPTTGPPRSPPRPRNGWRAVRGWSGTSTPETRSATVHRPGLTTLALEADEFLDGCDVVPGFRCRVGDLLP